LFWLGFLGVVGFAVFGLRDVLLPFVAGMGVAYLLDPVVDRLERIKVGRGLATLIVLVAFFLIALGAMFLLFPLIQAQVTTLSRVAPEYLQRLEREFQPLITIITDKVQNGEAQAKLPDIAGKLLGWLAGLVGSVISGGLAFANLLSLLVITPIVSFYLLRDWDKMVGRIDSWLPHAQADTIREQMRLIDKTLASFVRGQGTVCLVLGLFYAIGLSMAGLDFGLVIGLFAGLISFVPFVGTIVGGLLSVGLAIAQFPGWEMVAVVAAIFVAGQVIEGNFLTPNLVGEAVGLHPVWVIFALLAGGSLFGFVGVLLAVPVAAIVGVLARFGLQRYLASPLHLLGIPPPDNESPVSEAAHSDSAASGAAAPDVAEAPATAGPRNGGPEV
jgi:predicted PurR-regulated permease PerM